MTTAYPTLGFDPAPGRPWEVRSVAQLLADASHEVRTVHSGIEHAGNGLWVGQSATAFHDHLHDAFAPKLRKVLQAFEQASSVVSRWASELDDFQERARQLEQEAARQAEAARDAAHWLATHAEAAAGDALDAAQQALADQRAAERRRYEHARHEAEQLLQRARREAERLHEEVVSRARALAHLLHQAEDLAPAAPGLLSRLGNAVKDGLSDAWAWTKAHADTIKLIGDVLGTVSAVLGTIAILTAPFEPVGAVFAAAALGTGALAMGAHALAMAAGADVTWTTLAFDALGVIPGVKGASTVAKEGFQVANMGKGLDAVHDLGETFSVTRSVRTLRLPWQEREVYRVVGDGSLANRVTQVSRSLSNNLHQGSWLGTRGLNFLAGHGLDRIGLVARDPMRLTSRLIDAGIKIVPKTYTVPVTIHNDLHPDRPLRVTHPGEVFHALLAS